MEWLRRWIAVGLLLIGGSAVAEEALTYYGCTDRSGQPVLSREDGRLPAVVDSGIESGRPVIRYNAAALPELSQTARLFFYAHECARHNLGLAVDAARTPAAAHRADCWGLASLVRSGLVDGAAGVAALQGELRFSGAQWQLLPGPPRNFDLPACYEAELGRSSLQAPAATQPAWNACVRQCAETLRACKRSLGGDGAACGERYERCSSGCELRFSS